MLRPVSSIAILCAMASASPRASMAPHANTLYVTRGAPLAEVIDHDIKPVVCGPKRSAARANRRGDVWTRLDVRGRPAQTVRVIDSSVYDLTNCREIGFSGASESDLEPQLYATTRPAAEPAFTCHASATGGATASFVAATHQTPVLFCTHDAGGNEVLHAVSAGRKLIFAHYARGHWMIERTVTTSCGPTDPAHAFELVSILDMNDDGLPEIVIHMREADTYTDTVYTIDSIVRTIVEVGGGYA